MRPKLPRGSASLQHSFLSRQSCRFQEEGKNNMNRTTDPRTDLHKKKNLKSTVVCVGFFFHR
jgi:hypothetical protein